MKILLLVLLANTLNQSFNYKETNPNALFPYYTAVSDSSPLGHLSNPAYLPLWQTWYLSIDYGKPYLMEEINSGNLRAGAGVHGFAAQGAWNRFGTKEYIEDIFEGNAGYRPWKFISTGIGVSLYRLNIKTEEIDFSYNVTDFKLAVLLLPFDWLHLGYLQENIHSMADKEKEEDFLYPASSLGIAVLPARGITLTWNINRMYYGYINNLSITANMLSNLSIKAGYSRETSSYSMAVNLIYSHLTASYGVSYHAYLGSTHKLGITLSSQMLQYDRVNYNKKLYRQVLPERFKTIQINNSSPEELEESNLFSKEIAERIIKYRNVIGPVSYKGLIQIGMAEKELKDRKKYIKGLADDFVPKDENDFPAKIKNRARNKRKTHTRDLDTRKLLFQKLLEKGLSSSDSLQIAEFAKDNGREKVIQMIRESSSIDKKFKPAAIEICEDLL